MKINYLTKIRKVFFLFALFILLACEKQNPIKVEKVGEEFYQAQKNKDYSKALTFCSPQAFEDNPKTEWLKLLQDKHTQTGELIDFQRVSAETSNDSGLVVTALNYEVKYKELVLYERIVFLQEKNTYKIVGYRFDPEKPHKQ